jgi:dTDP-glucose 4,6-dehydratase/UDP-glucuronate decarboxylase
MESKIIKEDIEKIILSLGSEIKFFEGKTILITGANGFLGSYIADTISEFNNTTRKPCRLILINKNPVTENSRLGHLLNDENCTFISQDVGKPFNIDEKADVIIHAASRATPAANLEDPFDTIDANILGLRTLLDYSKDSKPQFLFFSSAEIYGNPLPDFVPTPENYFGNVNPIDKRASYAESKRLGETMCMDFFRKFEIPIKILRIFNIYGPGLRNDGKVIAEFFLRSMQDKKITIKSTGEAKRSFCYITDAITAILKVLISGEEGEVYNIGDDSNNVSIKELAELIKNILNNGTVVEINKSASQNKTYGIDTRYPDISKIKKIGFTPQISLNTGLSRVKQWYDEARNDS